jgi:hypothetical protein
MMFFCPTEETGKILCELIWAVRSPANSFRGSYGRRHRRPSDQISKERALGTFNLAFVGLGLATLLFQVVGYRGLPDSFLQEFGPFMPKPFHEMVIASMILLPLLAFAGFQLRRNSPGARALCQSLFVGEIAYFAIFWYRWPLGIAPLHWSIAGCGLLNLGFYLPIVTAYPLDGLILLGVPGSPSQRAAA